MPVGRRRDAPRDLAVEGSALPLQSPRAGERPRPGRGRARPVSSSQPVSEPLVGEDDAAVGAAGPPREEATEFLARVPERPRYPDGPPGGGYGQRTGSVYGGSRDRAGGLRTFVARGDGVASAAKTGALWGVGHAAVIVLAVDDPSGPGPAPGW